ncbi:MAG: DUF3303 family protein [Gammaproteobacteria bacterium]|nr:DUF3303 family protein [Gammaproteobacteria bacterium]MDX2459060.1 DUF3303 family protein [Gammaproteobacteria bacterium]
MLYMVIERFKNQDAAPVYRRFGERGRIMPEGLEYVSSWVDMKLERCFQVMETSDPKLMVEWIGNWSDIVEFEVVPVMSSADAARTIASMT